MDSKSHMTKGQTGIIVICVAVKFFKVLAVVTECGKHAVEYAAAANLKPRLQIWILIPTELLQILLIS